MLVMRYFPALSAAGPSCCTPPPRDQNRAAAQPGDGLHIVRDEQNGASVLTDILHLVQALALEGHVTHRQHLVDDQDLRLQMAATGKARRTYMPLE